MPRWLEHSIIGVVAFTLTGWVLVRHLDADNPLHNPAGALIEAFNTESVPGTACTVTGTDSVCVGDGAVAGNAAGDNAVLAIGARSTATGTDCIAIGENADCTGNSGSIAIGGSTTDASSADVSGGGGISIGQFSDVTGVGGVAFGFAAQSTSGNAIAIGQNTGASGLDCIAIGGIYQLDPSVIPVEWTTGFPRLGIDLHLIRAE